MAQIHYNIYRYGFPVLSFHFDGSQPFFSSKPCGMPSPLGRVAPEGPGEVRYNAASAAALRRIRTAYQPHPPLPLRVGAPSPKGKALGTLRAGFSAPAVIPFGFARPTLTFDVSLYTSFPYKCETMFRAVQHNRPLCGNNPQKRRCSVGTFWAKGRFFKNRMNNYSFILTNIRYLVIIRA